MNSGDRAAEWSKPLARSQEPSGDRLALEVAGREVDAQSHFVVVTMRETLFDALAYPVDPHDQFAFVVHLLRERGDVKWVVIAQQRRIGLQKNTGSVGSPSGPPAVLCASFTCSA